MTPLVSVFLPGCQQPLLCVWCTPEPNPHPSPGLPGPGWSKQGAWLLPVWGPEPPASALQSSSRLFTVLLSCRSHELSNFLTAMLNCTELCGDSIPTAAICHHPVCSEPLRLFREQTWPFAAAPSLTANRRNKKTRSRNTRLHFESVYFSTTTDSNFQVLTYHM